MKTIRFASAIALGLAIFAMSPDASAAGVALDSTQLDATARASLKAEIDKARTESPDVFKAVYDVAARAREIDAESRAPGIPFTRYFKNLGPRAFYPLVELMVFDSHAPSGLPTTAESALRIGVIEAVGGIRDTRAMPALAKVFETTRDIDTVRASANAIGKLGTDDGVAMLITAAKKFQASDPARERAILSGLHDCRREAAANFLAQRLDGQPTDAETAKVLIKSLGGVGNSWAWKTLPNQKELATTRGAAAQALVRAFVHYSGDLREHAAKALLVIDDPSTPALVAKAKSGASRETATALDDLDKRFAQNPVR
jgi:HEAT repeat protein